MKNILALMALITAGASVDAMDGINITSLGTQAFLYGQHQQMVEQNRVADFNLGSFAMCAKLSDIKLPRAVVSIDYEAIARTAAMNSQIKDSKDYGDYNQESYYGDSDDSYSGEDVF